MTPELTQKILAQVSEQDIVAMCCDVINIPSPTGSELEMARYMRAAFERPACKSVGRKWKRAAPMSLDCGKAPAMASALCSTATWTLPTAATKRFSPASATSRTLW